MAIAIGTRLTKPLIEWKSPDPLALIRVDIAPQDMSLLAPAAVTVVADSKDALRALLPILARHNRPRPSRTAEMLALHQEMEDLYETLQPQLDFIRAIRDTLVEDGIFVEGITQIGYASRVIMPVYQPHTFIASGYQGTLGWGFPTALGAKVAFPDRAVLSITGDGGLSLLCDRIGNCSAARHQYGDGRLQRWRIWQRAPHAEGVSRQANHRHRPGQSRLCSPCRVLWRLRGTGTLRQRSS